MNLSPLVAHLREHCPQFRAIGGAAELDAALQSASPSTPACYVMPMGEDVAETQGVSFVLHRVEVQFGVLIAVRNAKPDAGVESLTDLEPLRQSLMAALINHTPEGAVQPIHYAQGALLDFQPGLLWWQDSYKTAYLVNSA